MPRPQPLPDDLRGRAFDRAALEARRRSKGRATRSDLVHPYHGVHTEQPPATVQEHCRAYAVRLRPGQSFCHATAALLHGMPMPTRWEAISPLHVAAVRPASPPRTKGVVGHRLVAAPMLLPVGGLAVCAPSEAWVQLGADLTLDESIAVADHLLTVSRYGEAFTRRILERRIEVSRTRHARALRAALAEARCPVLSPKETELRLLLVRAGLPEPECNGEVFTTTGAYLGKPDLVWRTQRVGLEYEGGYHAEAKQVLLDVERRERYADDGWEIVRVTKHDLATAGRRTALVRRVGARLAARG